MRPTATARGPISQTMIFQGLGFVALMAGLALPGAAATGTVKGKVAATPAKYLEETVVYLKNVPGDYAPKMAELDQRGMKFVPHILTVTMGDTVEFLNHDTVAHNVFSPDNEAYNLGTFKPGEKRTYTFKKTGVYTQLCSIHPEMLGYVFVGQNPFSAVVDSKGDYTIKNVPAGTYEVDIWNSHLKAAAKKVAVSGGRTEVVDFSLHR